MQRLTRRNDSRAIAPSSLRTAKKLVAQILVLDSDQLRSFVPRLIRAHSSELLQRMLELLVSRAFEEDSGPASNIVVFFGCPAYLTLVKECCESSDPERGARIVGLLGRLGSKLSESEYIDVGTYFASFCLSLKGESLVHVMSGQRALRARFEEKQRNLKQQV